MLRYILKRLAYGAVTIWFIATATFFAMHAVPGDPFNSAKAATPQLRENLRARYGLDKPVAEQYLLYLNNMVHGDFGISFTQENRRVNDIIREHFPVSAFLGVVALLIATVGGVCGGAVAAYWQNRWPDRLLMIAVVLAISVPSFVIAALAQLGIVKLNSVLDYSLIPVAGWGSVSQIWVPALVLGLGTMAYLARLMRSSMLGVMQADYILTARAKGLGGGPYLLAASTAQRDFARGDRAWTDDRGDYDRRFRCRADFCHSRARPVLRSGGTATGLYRHYGYHRVLRRLSGLGGCASGYPLRLD